jgi:hypothetical protein
MEVIGIVCMLLTFAQPFILIAGMIKPQCILPTRKIKRKRPAILGITLFLFFVCAIIAGHTLPDTPSNNTNIGNKQAENTDTIPYTIFIAPHVVDSVLAHSCKETFDSLYNKLMEIDHLDAAYYSRNSVHKEIQKFLFDEWWNLMERIDSTRQSLPLSRKEYERSCKKYDKQYARFVLYGDEDIETVKFWAKSEAERVLRKLAVDPESLVIEKVSYDGKTKKGYKCTVIYRAKNSFGGYVREYVTLIVAYDVENNLYKCINII